MCPVLVVHEARILLQCCLVEGLGSLSGYEGRRSLERVYDEGACESIQ